MKSAAPISSATYRYFERIEAEEFIFTDASGNVSNKRQDLAGEKDCRKSDAIYDIDDTDVRLYPPLRSSQAA